LGEQDAIRQAQLGLVLRKQLNEQLDDADQRRDLVRRLFDGVVLAEEQLEQVWIIFWKFEKLPKKLKLRQEY
jgi:hypothetical protein